MRQIGLSAAVVTVGDEVVEGRIANANAVWLTERLMQRGIWPRLVVAVPDDPPLIVRQLRIAADTADLVVVSGGLGWTPDDVTRSAVAEAFYRDLARPQRRTPCCTVGAARDRPHRLVSREDITCPTTLMACPRSSAPARSASTTRSATASNAPRAPCATSTGSK